MCPTTPPPRRMYRNISTGYCRREIMSKMLGSLLGAVFAILLDFMSALLQLSQEQQPWSPTFQVFTSTVICHEQGWQTWARSALCTQRRTKLLEHLIPWSTVFAVSGLVPQSRWPYFLVSCFNWKGLYTNTGGIRRSRRWYQCPRREVVDQLPG